MKILKSIYFRNQTKVYINFLHRSLWTIIESTEKNLSEGYEISKVACENFSKSEAYEYFGTSIEF